MVNTQFHEYVSMLLKESGHMVTSEPIYINHTATETLYIDSIKDVTVTRFDRELLQCIENVSLLIELTWSEVIAELSETVQIYSITVDFSDRVRSELVADIHHLLHQYWSCDHSIVFFKNRNQYIISFADKEQSHILSDWFDLNVDYDETAARLNIGCMSLANSAEYFTDFIYAVARSYYLQPISFEYASYGMMPRDYIKVGLDAGYGITKEDIKELIRCNMAVYERQYGTNYVAPLRPDSNAHPHYHDITAELERLSFELELASDAEDDEQIVLFGFDSADDDFIEDDGFFDDLDADINDAIFDDPSLMVKWLERSQKQLDYGASERIAHQNSQNQEQYKAEQCEKARIEAERLERERLEAEQREKARIEAERLEQERLEAERREKARIEAERLEQERLEAERLAQKQREAERKEQQCLEVERRKKERLDEERKKREKLEAERRERARLETERKEQERIEAKRKERERIEAERIRQERLKAERKEQERLKLEHMRQQLYKQISERHFDAQDKIRQKYDLALSQLQNELDAVDTSINNANVRLQQLTFLQFLEKRAIKVDLEALTAQRFTLNAKISDTQNEYRKQTIEEEHRFNEQLARNGFSLNSV